MAEGGRKVVIGVDESSFAEEAFNCECIFVKIFLQLQPPVQSVLPLRVAAGSFTPSSKT